MTAFDRAIAVEALGDGAYGASSSPDWSVPRGANGGYLAAIVLRAMEAELADPARPARSITLHYLRPPASGPLHVDVTVERTGRTLSTLSARLSHDGRLCVIAVAAFAGAFTGVTSYSARMPDVAPADTIEPVVPHPQAPPIAHRVEMRRAIGALRFSGGDEALTGGWIGMREPQPPDGATLALYSDAWLPAPFVLLDGPALDPTIDLTIHFRNPAAARAADPGAPILGVFRSRHASDGLFEEDGELWSPDGVLLAHSRQLALLVALR